MGTPSPSHPMVLCVHQVARTERLCFGTSTMASICTPWTTPTPSTPSPSPPTGTGCALQLAPPSRYGTWIARIWWRNSDPRCLDQHELSHHSVSPLPGADGQTLFAGYSDNLIRVWQVSQVGSR